DRSTPHRTPRKPATVRVIVHNSQQDLPRGKCMSTITSETRPTLPPGEPRPIIAPLTTFYAHSRDLSYLVIRLTAGGMLLTHGILKVMPMAEKGLTATVEAFAVGSL